jgi:mycothiol synthase
LLKVRRFRKGLDEELYVRIFNAAFSDYDDMRSVTVEEAKTIANAPSFNLDGLMFGEWNGQTAGMVQAHVDKHREEKKGFIQNLSVLPEFRHRGIGRDLLKTAITVLKENGMKIAAAWAQTDRLACTHLYDSFGFKHVRTSSLMKRNLVNHSQETEENEQVNLREARLKEDEEIALIMRLDNEAFKEHFNYRPMTLDETKYMLLESPFWQHQKVWFAMLNDQPVGYVVGGIDEKLNREKNAKHGWILNIGVLKPHRRKDLGTTLMLQAMSHLKAQGMEDALLYVDDQNPTHAMKLYEKIGFQIHHKSASYELQLA